MCALRVNPINPTGDESGSLSSSRLNEYIDIDIDKYIGLNQCMLTDLGSCAGVNPPHRRRERVVVLIEP